jgi:hypothetical protein
MTVDVFAGHRSPYFQSGFFAESPNHRRVVLRCHKSSQTHKFVDDFEILVVIVFPAANIYFVIALLLLLLLVEDDVRRLWFCSSYYCFKYYDIEKQR